MHKIIRLRPIGYNIVVDLVQIMHAYEPNSQNYKYVEQSLSPIFEAK